VAVILVATYRLKFEANPILPLLKSAPISYELKPLNIIKAIILRAKADSDVSILWLYGSRATGEAWEKSDYDFAIAFHSFPSEPLERQVRPQQLAMTWAAEMNVDSDLISIVDINLAPIPLAGEILRKGKVLICKDALRLYREENRISGMIELDWNYHRSHYG
jgi:uncharacterized protein